MDDPEGVRVVRGACQDTELQHHGARCFQIAAGAGRVARQRKRHAIRGARLSQREPVACRLEMFDGLAEQAHRGRHVAGHHRHEAKVSQVVPDARRIAELSIDGQRRLVRAARVGQVALPVRKAAGSGHCP